MLKKLRPALWVIAACFIWALDPYLRDSAKLGVHESTVVFFETLSGLVVMIAITLGRWLRTRESVFIRRAPHTDWLRIFAVGALGSALANLLFTRATQTTDANVVTLTLLSEPLFVLGVAQLLRVEKVDSFVAFGAILAIFSAGMILLPQIAQFQWEAFDLGLGLLASLAWGCTTVLGKDLLTRYPPRVLVFWRWGFAFLVACAMLAYREKGGEALALVRGLSDGKGLPALARMVVMGTFAGVLPMYCYYRGLRHLLVSRVTILELLYPAFTVVVMANRESRPIGGLAAIGWVVLSFVLILLFRVAPSRASAGDRGEDFDA